MVAALGYRGPVDAVAGIARISGGAAKQRIRTGSAITSEVSLTGAVAPPRFPLVAAAVRAGRMGIEAAGILVAQLEPLLPRVDAAALAAAEATLVDEASGAGRHAALSVDLLRRRAAEVVAGIDHAGVRLREQRALGKRSLRFGREDADGLTPVHGVLLPVVAAQFQRLCDAHIKAAKPSFGDADASFDQVPGGADGVLSGVGGGAAGEPGVSGSGEATAVRADTRTREQKRHDVLGAILDAAARAADAPSLAGAPPTVTVTVQQKALDAGSGAGFIDGMDTAVSLDTIEQFIDSGGSQAVTLDPEGAVLSLGSVQRCFTPSQRRAINARDGGCLIPGCPIPAGWCEVHHVIPHRSGGATHVDNGVLLCWWHHRIIDSGPWRLRMERGVPQVRGPGLPDWEVATKRRTGLSGYDPPARIQTAAPPRAALGP
ncbi:HNH endonuclease signature motif containing protein [Labedella endophytica]|uniref:HNH endonuclease n=1 Tax=Labedella endophytica TaxID=1523160 RepID=A0A433JSU0_9MICO|nr:HNH endonuclease signature motif containing protein [Labedella endophytica]RUR01260.1 HNH endonuclease [Labedella endophytica]